MKVWQILQFDEDFSSYLCTNKLSFQPHPGIKIGFTKGEFDEYQEEVDIEGELYVNFTVCEEGYTSILGISKEELISDDEEFCSIDFSFITQEHLSPEFQKRKAIEQKIAELQAQLAQLK